MSDIYTLADLPTVWDLWMRTRPEPGDTYASVTARLIRTFALPVRLLTPEERAAEAADRGDPDYGPLVAVIDCADGRIWLPAATLALLEQSPDG